LRKGTGRVHLNCSRSNEPGSQANSRP
jgi:hypothetical protein